MYNLDNRKPPKNHKKISVQIWSDLYHDLSVEEAIQKFYEQTSHLIDPIIKFHWGELHVVGFQPMTEQEIAAAKKRSERARNAALARKQKEQEKEIQQLRKLQKKYPNAK